MKWEKWWREDATRQGRPCHLLITSHSLWLEGPTQMRTVVVLRPQGIHQSTLRVWMMYDRAELTHFKTGSNCCKSRSCKVKSFKLASLRQCMACVAERSKVNCLFSSLWGGLLCAATESCFMKTVQQFRLCWFLHCRLSLRGRTLPVALQWWGDQFQNTSVQLYLRTSR